MMSSSEMIVPKWNLREEEVEGEERKRSPHVQSHHHLIPNYVVPMCSDEVQELRWEKGQVGVHGVSEITNNPQRWSLESIVHQATSQSQSQSQSQQQKCMQLLEQSGSKRVMRCAAFPVVEDSGCASATREDTDTATMMTWNSFESPRSLKTAKIIADDDSVYHDCSENQDGERMTKEKSCRSQSSARRSRAAAIHNLSERRRRDRINEKMKALQKLVPNASKTDKASMLDEVIEYLKQLQAQVHMMSNARSNMPQMMMPLGMQQQLQMSLMARMGMGMGMGMGMLDPNNLTRNVVPPSAPFPPLMHAAAAAPLGGTTPFVAPPFTMPPMVPPPTPLKPNVDADAYNTFLAQCMNMELLNKMSALYRQQSSSQQASKKADAQGSSFTNSFAHST